MNDVIVSEARQWIGTPFRHQQSSKGQGADCVGLLRGVWRAVIGPEPEPCPPYPSRVDLLDQSILLEHARRFLVEIDPADAVAGNALVVSLREGVLPHHAMILSAPDMVIHAVMWAPRRVVETRIPVGADIAAAFAFPEVS